MPDRHYKREKKAYIDYPENRDRDIPNRIINTSLKSLNTK